MGNEKRSRAEEHGERRWGSAFNLTRLICLPHLSGFYFLLLAGPLSNLFGQALTHDAKGDLKDTLQSVKKEKAPFCDFVINTGVNVRESMADPLWLIPVDFLNLSPSL